MIKGIATALLAGFFSTSIFAHDITNEHYKTMSMDGKTSYDIILKSDSFTWKGLNGMEKGMSQVNSSKHTHLTDAIEVIQWKGKKNNSFNTLIIDENNLKYVYSGVDNKEMTLDTGTLERL